MGGRFGSIQARSVKRTHKWVCHVVPGYPSGTRHRVAYMQSRGLGALDSDVLHLCGRPYCVQPGHLYLGNAQDNADDRAAARGKIKSFAYLGDEKRWPTVAWPDPTWWRHYWMTSFLCDGLPKAENCHHHWGPTTLDHQRFCVLCSEMDVEEREEWESYYGFFPPILSEDSLEGNMLTGPLTPRLLTYELRLRLKRVEMAREAAQLVPWWLWEEINAKSDEEAVRHMSVLLSLHAVKR